MTDTTASNSAPEPQDQADSQGSCLPVDSASSVSDQVWEPVTFPGQISIEENAVETEAEVAPLSAAVDNLSLQMAPSLHNNPEPSGDDWQGKTHELVELIQDLNQCNDALLLRVAELEEALERSQLALQAEIERNQGQGAAPAYPEPAPVPQQIAQLLSELDIANDGLRRTTIHNEALQTELEANQQRVAQLERECTLLQQRFSEKNTALQQAEDTCRDLRARLHRQQRYTLQFKTALEKCLNTTAAEASVSVPLGAVAESPTPSGQVVAMPKAQQIQPWSAEDEPRRDSASLAHLLHSLRAPGQGPPTAAPTAASPEPRWADAPSTAAMMASAAASSPVTGHPQPDPAGPVDIALPVSATSQPGLQPTSVPPASSAAATEDGLQQDLWHSAPEPTPEVEPAVGFTEPSPWGPPLPQAAPEPVTEPSPWGAPWPEPATAAEPATTNPSQAPDAAMPAPSPRQVALPTYLQPGTASSPSPVVYPLRSQKKITSLAAVQLPSFGRNPRRS